MKTLTRKQAERWADAQLAEIYRTTRTRPPAKTAKQRALAIAPRAYVMETWRVALSGPSATLAESPHVKAAYLGG